MTFAGSEISPPDANRVSSSDDRCKATAALVTATHAAMDREADLLPSEVQDNDEVARIGCKAGCHFCCNIPVSLSALETVALAKFVESLAGDAAAQIKEKVALADGILRASKGPRPRHRCPLLDEQGLCSAYEVRPLSCRGLMSFDPPLCEETFLHPERDVQIRFSAAHRTLRVEMQQLLAVQERHFLGTAAGTFVHIEALHVLFTTPDAIDRLLAGEDVLAFSRIERIAGLPAARTP